MATFANVKPKRRKGGWIEVVEEAPAAPAQIVADPSPTIPAMFLEVPAQGSSPLTVDGIHQIIRRVTGTLAYQGAPDLVSLSISEQNLIIEAIVHGSGLSLSPSEIKSAIDDLERQGLANHFPGLVQVARRYLAVTIHLLEEFNRRDFSGAQ
jgi:hypothetical protein